MKLPPLPIYRIFVWDRDYGTWSLLADDFPSFQSARTRLDEMLSDRELAEELGLPAPVKIIPEAMGTPPGYAAPQPDKPDKPDKPAPQPNPQPDHALSKWDHVEDCINKDDALLSQFLDLAVNCEWTDEDAEIAVWLGLGADVIESDFRDYHIMRNLHDGVEGWSALGDPIDNTIAYWMEAGG